MRSIIFIKDFQEFISSLNLFEVDYILVGGYSVILHGYPRNTGDMEIWVNMTEENYMKISQAFNYFGLARMDMTIENFLFNPVFDVFTYGCPPVSIDILTNVKGLTFSEAWENSSIYEDESVKVRLIHFNDLLKAKTAAGRERDFNDIHNLLENKSKL